MHQKFCVYGDCGMQIAAYLAVYNGQLGDSFTQEQAQPTL